MAFSPYAYNPYGSPYYGQPPIPNQINQVQQPQIPTMQMQNQPGQIVGNQNQMGQNNSGMIWVSGFQAANEYLVTPNSAVPLWDSSAPYVYLKQADASGKPTLKAFELVERNPTQAAVPMQTTPAPDLSRFVTRDDVEQIITERLNKPGKTSAKKGDE